MLSTARMTGLPGLHDAHDAGALCTQYRDVPSDRLAAHHRVMIGDTALHMRQTCFGISRHMNAVLSQSVCR